MPCRTSNSIPGLYLLDASSDPPVVTAKISLDIAKCPLGAKWPDVENPYPVIFSAHHIQIVAEKVQLWIIFFSRSTSSQLQS